MFAIYATSKAGTPWSEMDDARLHDDCRWGCSSMEVLARRQGRPVEEVQARMRALGLTLNPPGPHSRKIVGS